MAEEIVDIAVIGAGPAGLAVALALSGYSIVVFEKARVLRPCGASIGLNESGYAALAAFNESSVAKSVNARAANPKWHVLQRPNGETLYDGESIFYNTPFTWLGWHVLQHTMMEFLPKNVFVHLGHQLISVEEESDAVRLTVSVNEEQIKSVRARIVVGADGYKSMVRQHTLSDGPPTYTGTMTWRGILRKDEFDVTVFGAPFHSSEENGELTIIGDRKNFWIMDCGDGQIAWTGTALQEHPEKSESARETVLKMFEGWPSITTAIVNATEPSAIVETGVFHREPVESWGVASGGKYCRVTLVGDAAHPMRPSLGLGATNAFQDALSLASKLQGVDLSVSSDVAEALAAYEAERIAVTTPLQRLSKERGESAHDEDQADKFLKMVQAVQAQKSSGKQER